MGNLHKRLRRILCFVFHLFKIIACPINLKRIPWESKNGKIRWGLLQWRCEGGSQDTLGHCRFQSLVHRKGKTHEICDQANPGSIWKSEIAKRIQIAWSTFPSQQLGKFLNMFTESTKLGDYCANTYNLCTDTRRTTCRGKLVVAGGDAVKVEAQEGNSLLCIAIRIICPEGWIA